MGGCEVGSVVDRLRLMISSSPRSITVISQRGGCVEYLPATRLAFFVRLSLSSAPTGPTPTQNALHRPILYSFKLSLPHEIIFQFPFSDTRCLCLRPSFRYFTVQLPRNQHRWSSHDREILFLQWWSSIIIAMKWRGVVSETLESGDRPAVDDYR